jgi:hypothetical protein
MIPAKLLDDARIFSSREALLRYVGFMITGRPRLVAEIGVAYGGFSAAIIVTLKPDQFHAFDTFDLHEQDCVFGSHPSTVLGDRTHREYYEEHFPPSKGLVGNFIWEGRSQDLLQGPAKHSFDFVYVDGGHSYDDVKSDIEQLKRVIKPGGIIMFDDYCTYDTIARQDFGVLAAVNEYIAEGHEVLGISLHPEGFHNIAVRA